MYDQITKEIDVMKMVNDLLEKTSDPNAAKEAFWEKSTRALYLAIGYLLIDLKEDRILSPVRLPVPPRRLKWDLQGSNL